MWMWNSDIEGHQKMIIVKNKTKHIGIGMDKDIRNVHVCNLCEHHNIFLSR
jgi:hypothetical protein